MPVTANLQVSVTGQHTNALDLGVATFPFVKALALALASGTGANQSDRVFTDTRTLTASATENLDLAGTLVDAFGATITFVTVKAVLIVAAAGNTNNVQVTRPASNGLPLFIAAGDGLEVKPNGAFAWFAPGVGIAVTAGTGDLLALTNSAGGTSVVYDVIIIGTSA